MMPLTHRVLVVGAGRTGLAVARYLARKAADVTITDKRGEDELASVRDKLDDELATKGWKLHWELGGHVEKSFTSTSQIIVSPGVPALPELDAARRRSIPVIGEIEMASRLVRAPIVGVTGTNGKSTVTALCGAIAAATLRPSFVGGNLGTPLIEAVDTDAASVDGLCVVELSSYQLETVDRMRPRAAAVLNLTPDHLDRYGSLEKYGLAKMNIARNMGSGDVLVMNGDDAELARVYALWAAARFGNATGVRGPDVYRFVNAPAPDAKRVAYCDERDFVLRLDGGEERYARTLSHLMGRHNDRNVLAALLLMRASGLATPDAVREGLAGFRALPHRMQLVAERGGVRYYDDSKATNVDSVVAGLDGFPVPFALILGGRHKGGSYVPLVDALRGSSCLSVVTIGEAAPIIERELGRGGIGFERAASMEAAVARARAKLTSGGAVVLSPACSSFDMFDNYEHRGLVFRRAAETQA
jgi:UDP-N-acetylmuramoylalanine--D-glutamate ligase